MLRKTLQRGESSIILNPTSSNTSPNQEVWDVENSVVNLLGIFLGEGTNRLNNVIGKFAEEKNRNISARLADSESELENCETMRADALQNISTVHN